MDNTSIIQYPYHMAYTEFTLSHFDHHLPLWRSDAFIGVFCFLKNVVCAIPFKACLLILYSPWRGQ